MGKNSVAIDYNRHSSNEYQLFPTPALTFDIVLTKTLAAEFFPIKGITFFGVNFEPFMDYIITIQLIGHHFLNPNLLPHVWGV